MPNTRIRYRSGYKYQLAERRSVKVSIFPAEPIKTEFITLGCVLNGASSHDHPELTLRIRRAQEALARETPFRARG